MNIFLLDLDPVACAAAHCDKHVVKMATEYAQLLSTAARLMGFEHGGYASTHVSHPCTQWAAASAIHWSWLYRLAKAVGDEYTKRYGREHAATKALGLLPHALRVSTQYYKLTPKTWALVVPEDCAQIKDPVLAYRQCYIVHKSRFAVWRYGPPPAWWPKDKIQGYAQTRLA